jgi:ParB family transcriptional regulator, chromosome partitioning protein
VQIERGLLKPDDAKRLKKAARAKKGVTERDLPQAHSAALVRRLTAQRTIALQATLAQRPDVALVALTHRLVLREFFRVGAWEDSVLHVDARAAELSTHLPEIERTSAHAALREQRRVLQELLPKDPLALFAWLLEQPSAQVLALLAFCVAPTLDAVRSDERVRPSDALAQAIGLDMRQWWTPTAENYLASVPKARILEVVREAVSPEVAAGLSTFKKAALVKAAEQRLAGSGWLPAVLRVPSA